MRQLLQNLAVACFSVLFALAAAEGFVRLFIGPVPPRNLTPVPRSIRAPSPFPDVPYLLAPNAEAVHDFGSNPQGYFDGDGTLTYRTNSLGLRDREVEREKHPGTFRILGLGDSFTFGTGVRLEHLFLTRLQELLDEAESGPVYEVLNLGVMGFNTAHEVALLQHFGVTLDPDLVLLCFVLNDAEVLELKGARDGQSGQGRSSWRPHSLLLDHLAARRANRPSREKMIARIRHDFGRGAPGWLLAQYSLAQARNLARERGFHLAVMIFPVMWKLGDDYPFTAVHGTISAAGKRLGIPVLDLLEAFRGEDARALWVHPSNQHPNARAHAIAGEALHRLLREHRLLAGAADADSGDVP